jgi:hypothetical protein
VLVGRRADHALAGRPAHGPPLTGRLPKEPIHGVGDGVTGCRGIRPGDRRDVRRPIEGDRHGPPHLTGTYEEGLHGPIVS